MVTADVDRDYYADLDLKPSAEPNDIKKAFKKLALKYHPDRNPGKELEFNAKFQAIQSANEVLTDPQQRARYDAQRMRQGLLHTYTNTSPPPSKPPVPTRAPATNFPPPPRPPPPPTPKSNFPPPPSGAQKYRGFRESTGSYATTGTDDTKARTNDYKAWEQMRPRHGAGPIPPGRPVPPKAPRATTFHHGRDSTSAASSGTTPRRSGWDRFQESQAGMPGVARGNTSRVSPKRTGFAPGTPGGDESQARSAYFNVSRGDRSANSRSQTHMPPPPSPVPTAKKPDPLQAFKDQVGLNEPFGKKKSRAEVPYQRGGGEGTRFPSPPGPGLHRSKTSASPRDSNSRTGMYESKTMNATTPHVRAASASSNHDSRSPPGKKDTQLPGTNYSSSSSASSSEDDRPYTSAKPRTPQVNATRQTRVPAGGQRRPGFNLYAEDAGDERMAPQASPGEGGYSGIRRHSTVDLGTDKPSEGFQEHRMKHGSEHSQQQRSRDPTTSGVQGTSGSQPSLVRSHSWQDKYGPGHREKWGSPPKDSVSRPGTGAEAAQTPMYESRGYNPFFSPPSCGPPLSSPPSSDKWSDQWPFKSPKKPRGAKSEPPPYWAIPSSLPPPKETENRKRAHTYISSRYDAPMTFVADNDPFCSFNFPNYTKKAHPGLRSQSSDSIDTKFSPDGFQPNFFDPTRSSRTATPLRTVSPTIGGTAKDQQDARQNGADGHTLQEDSSEMPHSTALPTTPFPHDKYSEDRWAPHLNEIRFDIPQSPQARSPSRTATRKRTKTWGPKLATAQATVNNVDAEPTANSATGESVESSNVNSDIDAMDIDEPTLPNANMRGTQANGNTDPPTSLNGTASKPRRAPTLPPRMDGHGQPQADAPHLNLSNLTTVYPFAPSNEGLANMNDIATNLPFQSRASPTKPATDGALPRVDLAQPPIGPRTPQSLTGSSCERFHRQVRSYLDEWYRFTNKMANVLSTRQMFNRDSSGFDLMNVEDNGYDDYMKGLEESRRARAHFDVACEKHYKTMQDFGLIRQEMKRGRGGVLE